MDECDCVMFDIPRAHGGSISYSSLESIKNGMVCNTKYETGVKVFNSPHVIIFANFPPDKPELLSDDRWNVVNIGDELVGNALNDSDLIDSGLDKGVTLFF